MTFPNLNDGWLELSDRWWCLDDWTIDRRVLSQLVAEGLPGLDFTGQTARSRGDDWRRQQVVVARFDDQQPAKTESLLVYFGEDTARLAVDSSSRYDARRSR
ncbi:hypothetical protein NL676_032132 [Syzygium grande]|nr:hypothetical protein NL676_032132 [Syzygium grande]